MDIKCMYRLYRFIRLNKPEIVHVHLGAIIYILISAIFIRKVNFYATIHSEAKREAGIRLSKWIRFLLFKLRLVAPITISPESEKSFISFYKRSGFMIPNGCSEYQLDTNNLRQFKNFRHGIDYLFLHAGRIQEVKNQIMLLKAFSRLIQNGIRARLLIAGRVEDPKLFEEMKPYFSENIVYIGEQKDIKSILSICDAFCLSSKMEGMPITIIEAFSVGCIPIVTPVGGCVNMIRNRENGFISENIEEDAYYKSLLDFIKTEKSALNKIIDNIKQDFQANYSINITASKYIEYFRS